MSFFIGNVLIENPIVAAPMAGVTNLAYRKILELFSPGLMYTEMVSDKAIFFKNKKTLLLMKTEKSAVPLAVQLFGSDIQTLSYAVEYINKNINCDIIDINMGCPVHKITKNSCGAKLLLYPDKIYDIIKNIVSLTNKPITVKMRLGWDNKNIKILENSLAVQEAGGKAVAIHARTASDKYKLGTSWQYIKMIKQRLHIPVIGNGDINSPELAVKRLQDTQCDGIMIGRGLLGNPWLIKKVKDYLSTGSYKLNINLKERFEIINYHLSNLRKLKGEVTAVIEFRSHLFWYIKGLYNNIKFKKDIQNITNISDLYTVISNYYKFLLYEEENNG